MSDNVRQLHEILSWLDAQPSLSRTVSAAARLRKLSHLSLPKISIEILRDSTLDQLLPFVEVACFRKGLDASVRMGDLTTVQRDVRDPQSQLYKGNSDIIVLALRLQSIAPELVDRFETLNASQASELEDLALHTIVSALEIVRQHSKATILVHNFESPRFPSTVLSDSTKSGGKINRIRSLNCRLAEEVSKIEQCFIVDVDHMISRIGSDRSFDTRLWHVAQIPYTPDMLAKIAESYSRFSAALKGKVKKCLVLDCDNTLWGGVIGEDGVAGIALGTSHPGSAYRAVQVVALELHSRGVFLAVNSKNNEQDVLEVLNHHPDCLLKPHHFAVLRANWNDKVTNLREIAAELNIGIDSLVFVDDNEAECALVRELLPEVAVVQLGADPTTFEALLRQGGWFDTLRITEEDRGRTESVSADRQRKQLQTGAASYEEYLKGLEMTVTIERGGLENGPRISQLSQKTNQFNLTTRRYSEAQIRAFLEDANVLVYSVRLRDKFGDSGLIGVAIVVFDGTRAKIDSFLLSCRVIARGVEDAVLAAILEDCKTRGAAVVEGSFFPTAKNAMAADFYAKRGFTKINETDFERIIDHQPIEFPAWFKEIHRIA